MCVLISYIFIFFCIMGYTLYNRGVSMKKINYLLLFLLWPCFILADECKIISETCANIGDEITCGSENFYVLSNDGNKIDMLSKYNLYVGYDVIKNMFQKNINGYIQLLIGLEVLVF